MVRLADLHEAGRDNALALECPSFEDQPFTQPAAAADRKVALLSTAGLIQRGDAPFRRNDAGFRVIDDSVSNSDLQISHLSINFDRTAAVNNIETIFPRQLCEQLVSEGRVGAMASNHYTVMGATDPLKMEASAAQIIESMKAESVNTAVLLPV